MQIKRVQSEDVAVNSLPDGSRVIVDSKSEKVFALNATAGAAWDACSAPTTLDKITQEMQRSLHPHVTEDLAKEAVLSLQEQELFTISGLLAKTSRRQALSTIGAVALPLVIAVTMAEQSAYAEFACSGRPHLSHDPEPHIPKHEKKI
jgi:hypothetical protein